MKKTLLILSILLVSTQIFAQKYTYYFITINPTSKGEVEVTPELGVVYSDIDTFLVAKRETKKNGAVEVTGKRYNSYSAFFNSMSMHGIEFVQFANLQEYGGATRMIAGDIRSNYTIWRRKVD
jgi:hypothetical protein